MDYIHSCSYITLKTTPHMGLITVFACITLLEHYSGVCMEVEDSCPDLHLGILDTAFCLHKLLHK